MINMQITALILFTVVLIIGVICYALYMIKGLAPGQGIKTPDEKTYRLAFLVFIVVVISYLGLGLGSDINENLIAGKNR